MIPKGTNIKGTALDRTGQRQSYKTEVAARLNWLKRLALGAASSLGHFGYEVQRIQRHREYVTEITPQRKMQLHRIVAQAEVVSLAGKELARLIEEYYTLPSTPQPKRVRQKALRTD